MNLEMKNIYKSFGAVSAVHDVSISVSEGEIQGLLGENGAGKSTLMNILGGVIRQDSGSILVNGIEHNHLTPSKAGALGIRFIHQELNLINDLRVYENLFLHNELVKGHIHLNRKEMIQRAYDTFEKMHIDIDPTQYVRELDTSRKQLVEIARALIFDCELIIMDEPTTALANDEIEGLFGIMRNLKDQGISCLYISHKMPELFSICDTYTVLRDGKFVGSGNFSDIDEEQATTMLVGRNLSHEAVIKPECIQEEVLFEAQHISCNKVFDDVSFSVRKGEILAFTGLFGDGRSELSEALFGARSIDDGSILLGGKILNNQSIPRMIKSGVSMVPRNRKERSIIKDMSILDNFSMAYLTSKKKGVHSSPRSEAKRFEVSKKLTNIKVGSSHNYITSLSGGNQQKVIFSRWFSLNSDVYILDNPTQGIDVGAKFEMYRLITQLAEQGKGVILFTPEFFEINRMADRCIVMYKGKMSKEFLRPEFNEVDMMYYATGAHQKSKKQNREGIEYA